MELDPLENWSNASSVDSDHSVENTSTERMSIDSEDNTFDITLHDSQHFLSGIIEGFYGVPWSLRQRENLIKKLGELSLSCYLYAPKNDEKHRKHWRTLHSTVESESLMMLIQCAQVHNVHFIYAISPGLDITFSSEADRNAIKHKLNQIKSMGCVNYAVFFDDIEPELCDVDAQKYKSCAFAQADLTNEIYEYLGRPNIFLFCPTEYCSSRSKPSVMQSEYLITIGAHLNTNIRIMWTGPRVVSTVIPRDNITLLMRVLQRKPVIWDNLHANDYDKQQIFLGPYDGRSLTLYPLLSGIFLNPNIQYELNFIPIHSFSMWILAAKNKYQQNVMLKSNKSLETSIHHSSSMFTSKSLKVNNKPEYDINHVITTCTHLWLKEFHLVTPSLPSEICLSPTHCGTTSIDDHSLHQSKPIPVFTPPALPSSSVAPLASTVTSSHTIPASITTSDNITKLSTDYKPMSPCMSSSDLSSCIEMESDLLNDVTLTESDLRILLSFFYLPTKLGKFSKEFLKEFCWIKALSTNYWRKRNGIGFSISKGLSQRRLSFRKKCLKTLSSLKNIQNSPNISLRNTLLPYILEVKECISMVLSYVNYLELREGDPKYDDSIHEADAWMSKSRFVVEVQKLLPSYIYEDMIYDVIPYPYVYTIRPPKEYDRERILEVCCSHMSNRCSLWDDVKPAERLVQLRYLDVFYNREHEMHVFEDSNNLCGYLLSTLSLCVEENDKVKAMYEGLALEEFRLRGLEDILQSDFSYPPYHEHIHKKYPLKIFLCFQPGFMKSHVITRVLELLIEKLKEKNISGMHILLDKFLFMEPQLLKQIGFSLYTDLPPLISSSGTSTPRNYYVFANSILNE